MKKYNTPVCEMTLVHSNDIMTMSGGVEELKFGMVFEMVAYGSDSGMDAEF